MVTPDERVTIGTPCEVDGFPEHVGFYVVFSNPWGETVEHKFATFNEAVTDANQLAEYVGADGEACNCISVQTMIPDAPRNPVTQLDGVTRDATPDEAHDMANTENRVRELATIKAWNDYYMLPHGITTDFTELRPKFPRPRVCMCENEDCSHPYQMATSGTHTARHVGAICDACAEYCMREYLIS